MHSEEATANISVIILNKESEDWESKVGRNWYLFCSNYMSGLCQVSNKTERLIHCPNEEKKDWELKYLSKFIHLISAEYEFRLKHVLIQ